MKTALWITTLLIISSVTAKDAKETKKSKNIKRNIFDTGIFGIGGADFGNQNEFNEGFFGDFGGDSGLNLPSTGGLDFSYGSGVDVNTGLLGRGNLAYDYGRLGEYSGGLNGIFLNPGNLRLSYDTPGGISTLSNINIQGLIGGTVKFQESAAEKSLPERVQFKTITEKVPVPVPVPVEVKIKVPVEVPKPYPVKVPHPVPYAIKVRYPVEIPKPYPVTVTKTVHVPVEKTVFVKVPHPVRVPVPEPYPVAVPQSASVGGLLESRTFSGGLGIDQRDQFGLGVARTGPLIGGLLRGQDFNAESFATISNGSDVSLGVRTGDVVETAGRSAGGVNFGNFDVIPAGLNDYSFGQYSNFGLGNLGALSRIGSAAAISSADKAKSVKIESNLGDVQMGSLGLSGLNFQSTLGNQFVGDSFNLLSSRTSDSSLLDGIASSTPIYSNNLYSAEGLPVTAISTSGEALFKSGVNTESPASNTPTTEVAPVEEDSSESVAAAVDANETATEENGSS